mgnify:FL=1
MTADIAATLKETIQELKNNQSQADQSEMYSLMLNRDRAEEKALNLKANGRKLKSGPKRRKAKKRYKKAFYEYVVLEQQVAVAKKEMLDMAIVDDESDFSEDSEDDKDDKRSSGSSVQLRAQIYQ